MKSKSHIIKHLNIKETSIDEETSIQNWIKEQCSNSKITSKVLEGLMTKFTSDIISELIERFKDVNYWQIIEIIKADVFTDADDERVYVVEKHKGLLEIRKHYESDVKYKNSLFSSEYVWQVKGVTDNDYYGSVLLPINDSTYIKIAYSYKK
jgi:hypothetical protein